MITFIKDLVKCVFCRLFATYFLNNFRFCEETYWDPEEYLEHRRAS